MQAQEEQSLRVEPRSIQLWDDSTFHHRATPKVSWSPSNSAKPPVTTCFLILLYIAEPSLFWWGRNNGACWRLQIINVVLTAKTALSTLLYFVFPPGRTNKSADNPDCQHTCVLPCCAESWLLLFLLSLFTDFSHWKLFLETSPLTE